MNIIGDCPLRVSTLICVTGLDQSSSHLFVDVDSVADQPLDNGRSGFYFDTRPVNIVTLTPYLPNLLITVHRLSLTQYFKS